MQSQIEDILMNIKNNAINVSYEGYREERKDLERCEELLLKRIKGDEEIWQLLDDYNSANENYNSVIHSQYYKEGFICGAKVVLEVCGWENKDKS